MPTSILLLSANQHNHEVQRSPFLLMDDLNQELIRFHQKQRDVYQYRARVEVRRWIYNYNRQEAPRMSESLCTKCQKFYGNPKNLNMCSVCYKQYKQEEGIKDQVQNFKVPEVPEQPPSRQQNHSRCFVCKKKIGLLGFRCKACDCSYCNGHRLPEDHKCDGNFVQQAKQQMKKNNPNITAPKIQKI